MLPAPYSNKVDYINSEEEIVFIDESDSMHLVNQQIITNEVTFKTEGDISIKKEV